MGLQWTTNPQLRLPTTAIGTSISPSGTGLLPGAWAALGTPSSNGALTGISFRTAYTSFAEWSIEIASGAAKNPIAAIRGFNFNNNGTGQMGNYYRCRLPIELIEANEVVYGRVTLHVTDTTAWYISATYYETPIVGSLETTTSPLLVYPAVGVAMPSVVNGDPFTKPAWSNSNWAQLAASAASDIIVTDLVAWPFTAHQQEYEVGLGVNLSEVTYAHGFGNDFTTQSAMNFAIPYGPINSGSEISMRMRSEAVFPFGGETWYFGMMYHEV